MADGDPMVLTTISGGDTASASNYSSLLTNGNFEEWSDTAELADGWDEVDYSAGQTYSRQTGARTGGAGTYFQRINVASLGASSNIVQLIQDFVLPGSGSFSCRGHYGRLFTFTAYLRETGTSSNSVEIYIQQRDINDTNLAGHSSVQDLSGTWTQFTISETIDNAAVHYIKVGLWLKTTGTGGSVIIDVDDAVLSTTYTFDRNPTLPDQQTVDVARRSYIRTVGNNLIAFQPASPTAAKITKSLQFGIVNVTQLAAFRSLYMLNAPMQWRPFHPHLPGFVDVRWTNEFNFRLLRHLAPGLYTGQMVLEEI